MELSNFDKQLSKPLSSDSMKKRNGSSSSRMPIIDSIHSNKEKKYLFNKIETEPIWDPFGTPGAGAPLKNDKNDLVSKLPNINENLWQRYAEKSTAATPSNPNAENKRKEMHELIDKFTQKKSDMMSGNIYNEKGQFVNSRDAKGSAIMRGENYWNDWFGRPGAGAPRQFAHKQNLDDMLEPRKSKFSLNSIENLASYNPSVSQNATPRKMRSNHHNFYEGAN